MLMLPYDWKKAHTEIVQAVGAGLIVETRIDDAVSRILSVKVRNGLYDDPYGRLDPLTSFGTDAHRTLAREAAAASYVLLKDNGVFPLSPSDDIHVTGPAADHVGYLAGGWTTYWQGNDNAVIGTGMSIQDALEERLEGHQGNLVPTTESSDTVIVVFTEVPYAEGAGDTGNPSIFGDKAHPGNQAAYETALEAKAEGKTVIGVLASGRPLILEDTLEVFDAFVAIFLPGSEGGPALADVMYGDVSFNGTLSFTWPATLGYFTQGRNPETVLFPFGHGLLEDNGNG
jgi:beta-glucosidase